MRSHDPSTFLDRTGSFLYSEEAQHHTILGAVEGLCRGSIHQAPPVLVHAETDNQVIGIVVGLDAKVTVTAWPEQKIEELGRVLRQFNRPVRNLVGPSQTIDRLISARLKFSNQQPRSIFEQRALSAANIYRPQAVAGQVRLANASDISLVSRWLMEYTAESNLEKIEAQQTRQFVTNQVHRQLVYLWCDRGCPVSMAQLGRATKNGISITAVFTPQLRRGRGYASNLVAEVSQRMLTKFRFCVLRTEAANKTSNKIYEAMGYQPIADLKSCYF